MDVEGADSCHGAQQERRDIPMAGLNVQAFYGSFKRLHQTDEQFPECWKTQQLIFGGADPVSNRRVYIMAYHVPLAETCLVWNWGLPCTKICNYWHICSHPTCLTVFDDTHKEIQHAAPSLFLGHSSRLKGMMVLHPKPLRFPESASIADTVEACQRYNVKLPSLNASVFEKLLSKTMIDNEVQASLVKGWRVGFDLGCAIPAENHFVKESIIADDQSEALARALIKERDLDRLHGPIDEPYYDGR